MKSLHISQDSFYNLEKVKSYRYPLILLASAGYDLYYHPYDPTADDLPVWMQIW
jgi:hypothetical protein